MQRRQVEHVLQALAVRLEDDRERAVAARDLEQALRLQPLLPERRALRPGRRRGISSARAAFSRKRAPKSAAAPSSATTSSSISSGSSIRSSSGGGVSASGRWSAMPSSDQIDCASSPSESRSRAVSAIAHGACTRAAERREDADAPVADLVAEALDHDRAVGGDGARGRLLLAQERDRFARGALVEAVLARQALGGAASSESATSSREAAPIASPSSYGRPTPSPFQNGTAPGTPGAGETSTRSRVISSIRQLDAPSRNIWPGARLVDHLLVQLADAAAPVDQVHAEEAAVGDRPGVLTASRRAPSRARTSPAVRSQTMRGRSSANSSEG